MDGLVEDCSNSIANALESLQFCTKLYIYVIVQSILVHFDPIIYLWNTVSIYLDLSYAHV